MHCLHTPLLSPPSLCARVDVRGVGAVSVAKHPYLVRWFRDKISLGIAGVRCLGNVMPTSFIPPGLWPGGMVTMAAQTIKICASGGIHPSRLSVTAPVLPAHELRNQHEIQKGILATVT
jgi:hypothetical protein